MIIDDDISHLPAELVNQFNKLSPTDAAGFVQELADTNILATVDCDKSVIYFGTRKSGGASIILLEAPQNQQFVFLPEGFN